MTLKIIIITLKSQNYYAKSHDVDIKSWKDKITNYN